MIFQCKMCGGTLEIANNDTVGVCEYCGTKQTLPRLDNDKKANLYERAAHFRQLNDYDKAMSLYEQVLAEDKTDAESYWSIVLCRYGIEYVEDPATHKRIPTVNRTQYTSIFSDPDYKSAIQYADPFQSEIYEQEAKAIDDIQKGILKISKNEKPFDIFICYKESDDNGRRTIDSVLAYDVYKELVGAGYKVFFSRITLEDKIGTAYEPYIFAALNSAPIMLVIGTKPEHFNAVWVKNEWSRFLGMIKSGAKKTLIPMYKDMSPYDLPEEFAHLQAQDMNNLGFMQDLLRGIKKIISDSTITSSPVNMIMNRSNEGSSQGEEISKLLSRADFALDNHQWREADGFFEDILKIDPKYAAAYVGKLMAEMQVVEMDDLKSCDFDPEKSINFKNAMRCADGTIKQQLISVKNTVGNARYLKLLRRKKYIKKAAVIGAVILVIVIAGIILVQVRRNIENTYELACSYMRDENYDEAISIFTDLGEYRDSAMMIAECEKRKGFATIKNAKVGDIVQYGNYNGNTDWIVLDKVENEKLMLLACDSIGNIRYSDVNKEVNWETCSLRKWLNETYINEAFSVEEKKRIMLNDIGERGSKQWRITGEKIIQDRVILPTLTEVNSLYAMDIDVKLDEMWILTTGFPNYYAKSVLRGNEKYKTVSSHVYSNTRNVYPEICINISNEDTELSQNKTELNLEDSSKNSDSSIVQDTIISDHLSCNCYIENGGGMTYQGAYMQRIIVIEVIGPKEEQLGIRYVISNNGTPIKEGTTEYLKSGETERVVVDWPRPGYPEVTLYNVDTNEVLYQNN